MRVQSLAAVTATAVLSAFTLGILACGDAKGLAEGVAAVETPAPDGVTIFLEYSPGRPQRGDTVSVTLRALTGSAGRAIGSFTGMLNYPVESLQFVAADEGQGALRAANPIGASIRVAGASSDGFPNGRLVTLRFLAKQPDPMSHLSLSVQELSGADLSDMIGVAKVSELVVATGAIR